MIARIRAHGRGRVGSYSHELGMGADRQLHALRYHASQRGRSRSSLGATSTRSHGLNRTYGFSLALPPCAVSGRGIPRDSAQKRAHVKARLGRSVAKLRTDRAGTPREATVFTAVGSGGAQHMARASIDIERAVLERAHRTGCEAGTIRAALARRPWLQRRHDGAARVSLAGISRPGRRATGHKSHESTVRWDSDRPARNAAPGAGREVVVRGDRSDKSRPRRARVRALRSPAATIGRGDGEVHRWLLSNFERCSTARCR